MLNRLTHWNFSWSRLANSSSFKGELKLRTSTSQQVSSHTYRSTWPSVITHNLGLHSSFSASLQHPVDTKNWSFSSILHHKVYSVPLDQNMSHFCFFKWCELAQASPSWLHVVVVRCEHDLRNFSKLANLCLREPNQNLPKFITMKNRLLVQNRRQDITTCLLLTNHICAGCVCIQFMWRVETHFSVILLFSFLSILKSKYLSSLNKQFTEQEVLAQIDPVSILFYFPDSIT